VVFIILMKINILYLAAWEGFKQSLL